LETVADEIERTPKEVCRNIIKSMPRRVEAVIKAKGGKTRFKHKNWFIDTVGKNSSGIPCDHPPMPRGEIHCICKAQSSERLIHNSPMLPRWDPP